MSKLDKAQMHQRPTYETLVRDTILEPKDKIALPDRTATILRKTQQLSRYDDSEFLDLEKDNENIAKETAQQTRVHAAAGNNPGGSLGQTRAQRPGPHQGHTFVQPPPPVPPPSGGAPPRLNPSTSTETMAPAFQAASSSGYPPQPPSMGPRIMTAQAATTPTQPQHFDLTIDDHMQDAGDDTAKVLAEAEW